ncbi:polysaccharide lyase [Acidobacteria bacterium AH-259-G07]|nr:polysaccharide lyase [Acidobacteria bacterium AH-259-G07]
MQGGYLWRYSEDLARREGERKATATMAWVQPPGTPSVGMVYLSAYEATGDAYYVEAARETAHALVKGQLRSAGWDYQIEFDPELRKHYAYRIDTGNEGGRNVSTLDDNTTQAALRLLMRVDRALDFKDKKIHEAVEYALTGLLKAQYPNGAWPQRYDRFPDPEQFPVRPASYSASWSRTYPGRNYRSYYTFNDNTIADMIDTMLEASRIYGEVRYKEAAEKAGGFILLAQMPEPQPAWAQQYDVNMHPAWARKFEPPAITGGESHGVMRTLLLLYRETGDKKYLEPLPPAIEYFRRSRLPDGRLARFYELRTNKPLFFSRDYKLTYSDADLPTHYAFKVQYGIESIAQEYKHLSTMDPAEPKPAGTPSRPRLSANLIQQIKEVLAALDESGRWVEEGRLRSDDLEATDRIIDCRTFINNVRILSAYLAATSN